MHDRAKNGMLLAMLTPGIASQKSLRPAAHHEVKSIFGILCQREAENSVGHLQMQQVQRTSSELHVARGVKTEHADRSAPCCWCPSIPATSVARESGASAPGWITSFPACCLSAATCTTVSCDEFAGSSGAPPLWHHRWGGNACACSMCTVLMSSEFWLDRAGWLTGFATTSNVTPCSLAKSILLVSDIRLR
jgi:hypothetical protein